MVEETVRLPAVVSNPNAEPAAKLVVPMSGVIAASGTALVIPSVAPELTEYLPFTPQPGRASVVESINAPALTVVSPL